MSGGADGILIPGGVARLGTPADEIARLACAFGFHPSVLAHEQPERVVEIPSFVMDRHEVTHADYARFVAATGHPAPASWPHGTPPRDLGNHPVTQVTWFDAWAYAAWAGKRLPTADEWEYAARGPEGLRYPWGDDWDPGRCNAGRPLVCGLETETTPVDAFPDGASPFGVLDLAGNVAEWTADAIVPGHEDIRIVKSAGWCFSEPWCFRAAYLGRTQPSANVTVFVGFRCAADPGEGRWLN